MSSVVKRLGWRREISQNCLCFVWVINNAGYVSSKNKNWKLYTKYTVTHSKKGSFFDKSRWYSDRVDFLWLCRLDQNSNICIFAILQALGRHFRHWNCVTLQGFREKKHQFLSTTRRIGLKLRIFHVFLMIQKLRLRQKIAVCVCLSACFSLPPIVHIHAKVKPHYGVLM